MIQYGEVRGKRLEIVWEVHVTETTESCGFVRMTNKRSEAGAHQLVQHKSVDPIRVELHHHHLRAGHSDDISDELDDAKA